MEKLAANFHYLKIVEVLVKSCCPQVSAMTAVPSGEVWGWGCSEGWGEDVLKGGVRMF